MLRPMLASLADAPLDDPAARLRTEVRRHPRDRRDRAERARVRLWSRLGNEKTRQFPEIAAALGDVGAHAQGSRSSSTARSSRSTPRASRPAFRQLQGRIHLPTRPVPRPSRRADRALRSASRVAFIAFDLLRDGKTDYPRSAAASSGARRSNGCSRSTGSPILRISEQVRGDGRALYKRGARAAAGKG